MATILCVDDEPATGVVLEHHLTRIGHRPLLAASVEDALKTIARTPVDLIIADYRMPKATGLDLLSVLEKEGYQIPVIIMTGYSSIEHAVISIKSGAIDYLTKPIRPETLEIAVTQALEVVRLRRENEQFRREINRFRSTRALVGESPKFRRVMETIATVAPTKATVLLEGESGTGKELFARAVHDQSPRHDGPFIAINCAAMPEGLVESALFGHEKGAFTGATTRTAGAFERAHGGTLLLDEISEMRLDLQAKLLRVIQEHEFERVGGHQAIRVDVRLDRDHQPRPARRGGGGPLPHRPVLSAQRRADQDAAAPRTEGRHPGAGAALCAAGGGGDRRLGEQHRARGDRPAAASLLARQRARAGQRGRAGGDPVARRGAPARGLPGNAGLRAQARRRFPRRAATALIGGSMAAPATVPDAFNLDELERQAIQRALTATGGNRTRAAKLLGISERTLRNKLNPRREEPAAVED